VGNFNAPIILDEVPNDPGESRIKTIIMKISNITMPINEGINVVQIRYTSNIPSLSGEHVSGFLKLSNFLNVLFRGFDELVFPIYLNISSLFIRGNRCRMVTKQEKNV
jgi:hypothetical protein